MCKFVVADSDDSDAEGGLGNVTRQIMRPPGHSGKAKRGHLCFDASFETGRSLLQLILYLAPGAILRPLNYLSYIKLYLFIFWLYMELLKSSKAIA